MWYKGDIHATFHQQEWNISPAIAIEGDFSWRKQNPSTITK